MKIEEDSYIISAVAVIAAAILYVTLALTGQVWLWAMIIYVVYVAILIPIKRMLK
jgi:fatty acid desaturase